MTRFKRRLPESSEKQWSSAALTLFPIELRVNKSLKQVILYSHAGGMLNGPISIKTRSEDVEM